jgi:hypothetical protein
MLVETFLIVLMITSFVVAIFFLGTWYGAWVVYRTQDQFLKEIERQMTDFVELISEVNGGKGNE